ncbi:hypothetical protein AGOR_G00107770 [Albula goreensis]|uniref:Uncharacterized protein n=1 Tax=Albula goreensis TaxID=1534307 RepID=A0A8T3DHJ0_9TELE|nr:hypothetical protein AGOR_G00107770 [Albula goreensis]
MAAQPLHHILVSKATGLFCKAQQHHHQHLSIPQTDAGKPPCSVIGGASLFLEPSTQAQSYSQEGEWSRRGTC